MERKAFSTKDYCIETDGVTVWINNTMGHCIGRFGRNGIDIHHADPSISKHCVQCTHEVTTPKDWKSFQKGMKKHHNVEVPKEFCPKRFQKENKKRNV